MSKDRNLVVLLGVLQDPKEQVVTVDGQPAYVVEATVATDLAAYGGNHRVLFTGQAALRTMATWQACQEARSELELSVSGWLRSGPQEAVVVCDRATFLVGKQIHTEAMRLLSQVGKPAPAKIRSADQGAARRSAPA